MLVKWETGWSSQTGVSQCGILHGSTADMPAFRWVDKSTGEVVVSNHPKCAAAIEQAHSDGNGLLAHNGSSYGNLFSGDAERAVLTMSGAGRRKEGRTGAGYFGYFTRPGQATRTMIAAIVEIGRERRGGDPAAPAGRRTTRRAGLGVRAAAHVHDGHHARRLGAGRHERHVRGARHHLRRHARLRRGRPPLRARTRRRPRPCCATSTARSAASSGPRRWAPRPYKIVVLSDHGQTQGATFDQRTGQTLAALVAELCGAAASGDTDAEAGRTESTAWLRQARHPDGDESTETDGNVARRPDRARLRQPRADLDPRRGRRGSPARRSTRGTRG